MTKTIVIVGGGLAGTQIANSLEKVVPEDHQIILIERRSHFYYAVAGARLAVVDKDDQMLIPYTRLFGKPENKVIQASVIQMDSSKVVLDREISGLGKEVQYNYLIIATGSKYPLPGHPQENDLADIKREYATMRYNIKLANSVLLVGGGAVGIELAGEIRENYPDKKISIIHPFDSLLSEDLPDSFRKKADQLVKKNKIDVIYKDSIVNPPSSYYFPNAPVVTKEGKSVNVDLVILTYGNRPATEWISDDIKSANGYIKVRPTLQVDHPDYPHVFVAGDAADLKESKQAFRIPGYVTTVTKNLMSLIQSKKPSQLHKTEPKILFLAFGTKQGTGYTSHLGGFHVGSWIISKIKGENLLVDKHYITLNQKQPE
ncbi:hypothetical protein BDB01DRAFT_727025 [Pilobolus umbonatus]|nr:hypothetical protein BDB01DRAFT_727025 [Pilobolus umbonatus]